MKKKIQTIPVTCPSDELVLKWVQGNPKHREAWQAYRQAKTPTNKDPDWCLSKLPTISWQNYRYQKHAQYFDSSRKGITFRELSNVPFQSQKNKQIRKHEQLICAAYNSGGYVSITKEISPEPFILKTVIPARNILLEHLVIVIEEGVQVVIHDTIDASGDNHFLGRSVSFIVKEGAHLSYIVDHDVTAATHHFSFYSLFLHENSCIEGNWLMAGDGYSKCWADFYLMGRHAQVDARFLMKKKSHGSGEIIFYQEHTAPRAMSKVIAKGLARDHAHVGFQGAVTIHEGAMKSDADQKSAVLLLSENARAVAVPSLEVKTDDVQCAHGSAIGKLSKDDLFYLQARGQRLSDARNLLIRAFIADCLPKNYCSVVR